MTEYNLITGYFPIGMLMLLIAPMLSSKYWLVYVLFSFVLFFITFIGLKADGKLEEVDGKWSSYKTFPVVVGLLGTAILILSILVLWPDSGILVPQMDLNFPVILGGLGCIYYLFEILEFYGVKDIPNGHAWISLFVILIASFTTKINKFIFTVIGILFTFLLPFIKLFSRKISTIPVKKEEKCSNFYKMLNTIKWLSLETSLTIIILLTLLYYGMSQFPQLASSEESDLFFGGLSRDVIISLVGLILYSYSNIDGPTVNAFVKL